VLLEKYEKQIEALLSSTVRSCNRETKTTGKPCANKLEKFQVACRVHRTESMLFLEQLAEAAYRQGRNEERELNRNVLKLREQQTKIVQPEIRLTDQGQQAVTCGKLSYKWDGTEPLQVGDIVTVPGNWLFNYPRTVEVTELGTSYVGSLQTIIRKE
jgi:hypothetical protein